MFRLRWFCFLVFLFCLFSCRPRSLPVSSLPSTVNSFEGYASILTVTEKEASRSKFSFVVRLPSEAKMDVLDAIGRTVSQILISQSKSYLIIPRKKVFWEGKEEEVFQRILGLSLTLKELSCIFLQREGLLSIENGQTFWELRRDSKGRIVSGNKGSLAFRILEFSGQTSLPRQLEFSSRGVKVIIRLLGIDFNKPVQESVFAIHFLKRFEEKTWSEIEELMQK